MTSLRETAWFRAHKANRGVRITVKDRGHYPRSRIVSDATWTILSRMSDASFNGSWVLELRIGTYASRTAKR